MRMQRQRHSIHSMSIWVSSSMALTLAVVVMIAPARVVAVAGQPEPEVVAPLKDMLNYEVKTVDDQLNAEYGKNKLAVSHSKGSVTEIETKDGSKSFNAWVDDENWVLILAYDHAGGDLKALNEGTIPLSPGGYSHAAPAFLGLGADDITAIRFFCRSSGHSRTIDFMTMNKRIIRAMVSGQTTGTESLTPADWTDDPDFAPRDRHSAYLPKATTATGSTDLFTTHLFYTSGSYHWNIRTWDEPSGQYRFECDDRATGAEHATIHQIWVRVTTLRPKFLFLTASQRDMLYAVGLGLTGLSFLSLCWCWFFRRGVGHGAASGPGLGSDFGFSFPRLMRGWSFGLGLGGRASAARAGIKKTGGEDEGRAVRVVVEDGEGERVYYTTLRVGESADELYSRMIKETGSGSGSGTGAGAGSLILTVTDPEEGKRYEVQLTSSTPVSALVSEGRVHELTLRLGQSQSQSQDVAVDLGGSHQRKPVSGLGLPSSSPP